MGMFLLTDFSPFMGPIILFFCMPGNFLLMPGHSEFSFVECWIFFYILIFLLYSGMQSYHLERVLVFLRLAVKIC